MAWNKMPLASGTSPSGLTQSVREFEWLIQFWEAIREREWALGSKYWPRQSQEWYVGTVGSIGPSGSIVNSSGMWLKESANNPWTGSPNSDPFAPPSWGVFVEAGGYTDYRKVLYADVVDWTSGNPGSLIVPKLGDYVVSKEINSLNDLVGKQFFIVRKNNINTNNPTLRWSDRWPQWSNADELIYGTISSAGSGYIVDNNKHFSLDQYAGNQIAVRDGSGYFHRVVITPHPSGGSGNYLNPSDPYFEHTLFFTPDHDNWTPTGAYAILSGSGVGSGATGAIYRLGREKHQPWAWYRGAMDQIWSHFPVYQGSDQGFLSKTYFPATQVVWSSKRSEPPHDCILQNHPGVGTAFDLDMWSDVEEECGAPLNNDRSYSPHIWKTWRALQVWMEDNCYAFVEKKDYTGSTYIHKFVPATFFKAANIGTSFTTSVTSIASGNISVIAPISPPYDGLTYHYAMYDPTPSGFNAWSEDYPTYYGTTTVTSGTYGYGLPFSFGSGTIGYTVVLSTGWKRFIQRKFKNKDIKTNFIPDIDGATGFVIDPARVNDWDETREFGVGHWRERLPSTGYIEEGEGPTNFNEGDVAWYVGSNWNDPIDGGNSFSFNLESTAQYYDHAYEGVHPELIQYNTVYSQIYGTVHEGSVYRLADYTKNWRNDVWYGGGTGHIETGTVTTGTTTTMQDTSKKVDQQSGAFWTQRFPNASGIPYLDFIIEFLLPTQFTSVSGTTDTELRWHKRPIKYATADTSKVTAQWAEPLPSDPTGKTWRIIEPKYEINRWKDYLVYIKYKTGQLVRTFVANSDDNTLYFDPPLPSGLTRGDKYSIIYPHTGNAYRYTSTIPTGINTIIPSGSSPLATAPTFFKAYPSGYWIAPRGQDAIRMGVSPASGWHSNLNENLPTIVRRYGRFTKGDCCEVAEFYDQLYRGINALVWTKTDTQWTKDPNNPSGVNEHSAGTQDLYHNFDEYLDTAQKLWDGVVNGAEWTAGSNTVKLWGVKAMWDNCGVRVPGSGVVPHVDSEGGRCVTDFYSPGQPPYANLSASEMHQGPGSSPPFDASAAIDVICRQAFGKIQGVPTIINHTVDWYAYCGEIDPQTYIQPGEGGSITDYNDPYYKYEFDDHHTNLKYRAWGKWYSNLTPTNASGHASETPLGNLIEFNYPSSLPSTSSNGPYQSSSIYKGYAVTDQTAIVKWDVAGGMTYI